MLLRALFSRELFWLGISDLRAHKLRSFLTALGIIFGVGAVITMLSIGEGASAERLESFRLLGSQNIIIRSVEPPASSEARESSRGIKSYGISRQDVDRLRELPFVEDVVLMREVADTSTFGSVKFAGPVLGTTENLFSVISAEAAYGRVLTPTDEERAAKVCVIGADVARQLFGAGDPLGKTLSVRSRTTGMIPYQVVGVLREVASAGKPTRGTHARDVNRDVYIPLTTVDRRYGDLTARWARGSFEAKRVEMSDVYLRASSQEVVLPLATMVHRVMEHGHKQDDFAIMVPLELIQAAEKEKQLSQIVLGSIAGISLLVGGIGIMNIMLASVTERTREIGIRRALGAKRAHITAQFLIETVILSGAGGLIGIGLGVGSAKAVSVAVDWNTIVPLWGVLLSFFVSAAVGISFGLYPARKAASVDPIEALRYE